jgi:predicted Fe-S protein YdhL (DUF1289 family)
MGDAQAAPRGPDGRVASPCINVCQMDAVSGWCAGCLRSLDEIATWSRLDDGSRLAVWALLPERRAAGRARGGSDAPSRDPLSRPLP